MKKYTFIIGISIFLTPLFSQLIINEYSASNLTGYTDNYGMEEDWIELYNTGEFAVDLGGYYLSDDTDNPTKWVIPNGIIIQSYDYLTFWCSGRDEFSGGNYHTNFKLKQTKNTPEHLVFTDPDGNIINDLELQKTQLEHSMGLNPNAIWKIFPNPTKGEMNTGIYYSAYADPAVMSVPAGFYDGPRYVVLYTDESNADIFYTVNGDAPDQESTLYTGLITISNTQIVKAIVIPNEDFCCEILPSFITFNTYFIDENHSLPVLSTAANQLTTLLNGNQSLKPHGTIEYFDIDGERVDFGYGEYNKHGQDSWAFPQRSFDYIARDEMGYHDAIHEKLLSLSDRDEFQRIIIRASGDDNYPGIDSSAHMRDIFIQKMANKNNLNIDMRKGERCVVYANGQFWGIYSIREKVSDADYTEYYYGQDKYNIQYLMNWGGTWAQYGGAQAFTDWNEIHNYALSHDLSIQANYQHVADEIDVTSLVDYILINSFVVCTDWINWNTSWWRGLNPDGEHTKWGYVLWDEDATFNHYINYTNIPNENPDAEPCYPEDIYLDPEGHIDLLNKLMENDEFMQYYNTRYMDLMNTAFQKENLLEILEGIENSIAPDMPQHIARWGGSLWMWQNNVQKIKDFINDRIDYLPNGLNSCYDLTGPYEITLDVEPAYSGKIKFNSITIENGDYPWTGMYHGGIEMLMEAVQTNSFDHWEFENHFVPDPDLTNISVSLFQSDNITAVYLSNETTDIVINEINYHSSDDFDPGDWVELYNPTDDVRDLGNWIFKDEDDDHIFTIPEDVTLAPDEYIVLCRDDSAFSVLFSEVNNYIGNLDFGLSGGGELIRLYNSGGALVDSVHYNDSDPWPEEPDGNGPTLELIDPYSDNAIPINWTSSSGNGTPGSINSVVDILGDLNGDGLINVLDVVLIVNLVLDGDYNFIADMNADGIVNVLDIVQLVNIILGNSRIADATFAELKQGGETFYISGNGYIGAVQMTLSHDFDFKINLTDSALVSVFRTHGTTTTLIVVAPTTETIFTTSDTYKIDEVVVTNSSEIINTSIPSSFSLSQAYPNPFNSSTNIDFSIPTESYVSIKVYDILGKEVASLTDQQYSSGSHSLIWNADEYSSGIYFVKLVAQNFTSTQKLMLIK